MTTQFITAEHKDQLANIPARDMVRAHMINAIPQDGTMIAAADVTDYIRQMIGPIYELCAPTRTARIGRGNHQRARYPRLQQRVYYPRGFPRQARRICRLATGALRTVAIRPRKIGSRATLML